MDKKLFSKYKWEYLQSLNISKKIAYLGLRLIFGFLFWTNGFTHKKDEFNKNLTDCFICPTNFDLSLLKNQFMYSSSLNKE